ncbi:MAG: hypothetical protein QM845_05235 [Verrucomicrobiota bacterium]|nr:hypothetical protein [Verrucomicrobiota bacterium]
MRILVYGANDDARADLADKLAATGNTAIQRNAAYFYTTKDCEQCDAVAVVDGCKGADLVVACYGSMGIPTVEAAPSVTPAPAPTELCELPEDPAPMEVTAPVSAPEERKATGGYRRTHRSGNR